MSQPLVSVSRGSHIESIHRGSIAVVRADGYWIAGIGDVKSQVFARSSLKPFQALPMLVSGAADQAAFTESEIALCCSSHRGEDQHINGVAAMLNKLGLTPKNLQCGASLPANRESSEALLKLGGRADELHHACSGKHTGLLAQALKLGSDPATYHLPEHPVQASNSANAV